MEIPLHRSKFTLPFFLEGSVLPPRSNNSSLGQFTHNLPGTVSTELT